MLRARATRILALTALAAIAACTRSAKKAEPAASLAASPQAAVDFVPVHDAWHERRSTLPVIDTFLAAHPSDGLSSLARVYRAFVLLGEGRLAVADSLLASLQDLPRGTTNDLATVARARSLRLHGAPQSALDMLRSLVGKMVDDTDREVFLEEIALTSIAAHDDYEAIAYLDAWLHGVGEEDKDRVRAKIDQLLATMKRSVLEQTYRTMRARGAASGYGADTQRLVAERLARIAVESNDAALARWLVDESGVSAAQTGGDAGIELGELAASRRGLASFAGRTVGLLLPTRDRELRDEAADIVRGVSWSLDLPRSAGAPDAARLVTREDGADEVGTRSAMAELAGEGAAVIIAGFDHASADRAAAWSEENGIPVLLLAAPTKNASRKTSIVLGERPEREVALLGAALVQHGVSTAAFVADTKDDEAAAASLSSTITLLPAVRCDVPIKEAGRARYPLDAWRKSGARGWLVSGSPSCARDVLHDLGVGHVQAGSPVALTLEAGLPLAEVPRGVIVLAAAAGIVPVTAAKPEEATDVEIRTFMDRFGVRPSWWTALGHDAGALAKASLAPLPIDTTTDPKAISQRRAIVQAGLLATRVRLWTSDEKGVSAGRVLERSVRILTWQLGARPPR